MVKHITSRLESFFGTDMAYLTKGGTWLLVAKFTALFLVLLSSVAFANFLPEETYGTYRFILSVLILLTIPTLPGMDNALIRSLARGYGGSAKNALFARMRFGTIGSIASLLLAGYYMLSGNDTFGIMFIMAAFFIPFMEPFSVYVAMLNGKKKFNLTSKYISLTRIVATIALVATVFFTDNILIIIFVYFTTHTLVRLFFIILSFKKLSLNDKKDPSLVPYGKHLTLIGAMINISTHLDKILVFYFLGGAQLAGYWLALMPYKQIKNIFSSVNMLALPKFSEKTPAVVRKTLPCKLLKSYLFIVPAIIIYILIVPFVFETIYPKYTDFVLTSQLFSLMLLLYPATIINTSFTALKQKNKLYIAMTSTSIIRIILLLATVPIWGYWGAVTTILVTTTIGAFISLYLFLRQ